MKATAVLVNTLRGLVVDEAALTDALAEGPIAATGLGVFEREPEVHPMLVRQERALIVPLIASASVASAAASGSPCWTPSMCWAPSRPGRADSGGSWNET